MSIGGAPPYPAEGGRGPGSASFISFREWVPGGTASPRREPTPERLATWLKRGLADCIELAYCAADELERRFTLQYVVLRGGPAARDDDPGGITAGERGRSYIQHPGFWKPRMGGARRREQSTFSRVGRELEHSRIVARRGGDPVLRPHRFHRWPGGGALHLRAGLKRGVRSSDQQSTCGLARLILGSAVALG